MSEASFLYKAQKSRVGMRWRREFVHELVRQARGIVVLPDLSAIFNTKSPESGTAYPAVAH